jgi:hypothetical protein
MDKMRLLLCNRIMRASLACLMLCFLLAVAIKNANPSLAEGPSTECNGLDIVYLIDQSGSMAVNDKYQIRSDAVHTAIDILGDNAVYFCPGVQHRIAVLGFGDQPVKAYIGSALITPTLQTLAAWSNRRIELKASIPVTDDLNATDPTTALAEAAKILANWQQHPIGSEPRKRAVVVITDGGPCIPAQGCILGNYTFDLPGYMKRLEVYTNPLGTVFPWRGADNPASVYLWVIGFRDAARTGGYDYLEDPTVRQPWNRITQGHGGDVLVLQSADQGTENADLTTKVANVLNQLLGSRLKPWDCREAIWVDPYLSNVTIMHIFRRGANPGVSLENVVVRIKAVRGDTTIAEFSRGQVVAGQGKVDDYTQDGPNERYVFYLPPPGQYLVEVRGADICRDLDVRIGQSGIRAEVQKPPQDAVFLEVDKPPYYDASSPTKFRLQLLQQSSGEKIEPLQENPDFPLDVQVIVRSQADVAERVEDVYPLVRVDNAQAIYESRDYIRTRYPGHYTWDLTATTKNPRSLDITNPITKPVVVLQAKGSFRVTPIERTFDFTILHPREGDEFSLLDGVAAEPLQVEVQILDETGNPMRSDLSIAPAEASPLRARLVNEKGQAMDTQPLKPQGMNTYAAELRSGGKDPNRYDPGCYKVVVELTGDYRSNFHPKQQAVTLQKICMIPAERFNWQIVQPISKTYTIHPMLRWFPPPLPLPLVVQVESQDGRPLVAADVLRPGVAALLGGRLHEPGRAMPYELTFRPGGSTGQFVADWPVQATGKGSYLLEVSPVKGGSAAAWIPTSETAQSRSFWRQDTALTMPWSLLALITLVVLVVGTTILIYLASGPLSGAVLVFTKER